MSAQPFSADLAFAWGMVNRLVPGKDLIRETIHAAETIAGNAPLAIRKAKHAICLGAEKELQEAMLVEIESYNHLVPTKDRREGTLAFNEGRRPHFLGK